MVVAMVYHFENSVYFHLPSSVLSELDRGKAARCLQCLFCMMVCY